MSSADLGGRDFGPVAPNPDEPMFHAEWEKRVLGMVVALGAAGQWNLDQSRSARESLPEDQYVSIPYYHIWLEAVEALMRDRGMITDDEMDKGHACVPPVPVARTLSAADVPAALAKGGPVDRPATSEPVFAVGARVRTMAILPGTHTRLPRYAADKVGEITAVHGHHVFPDSNAVGAGEAPTWLYKVAFVARDLFADGHPDDRVSLDLWEPYLSDV